MTIATVPETENLRADYDRARRHHDDALRAFRDVEKREQRLRTERVMTTQAGEEKLVGDEPEAFAIARAELEDERRAAAYTLRAARKEFNGAAVAYANDQLAKARVPYKRAVDRVHERAEELSEAWCEFIVRYWRLAEVLGDEQRSAQLMLRLATDAAPSEDVRGSIRHAARLRIPAAVDAEGPSDWLDRASPHVLGGLGDDLDPRHALFWQALQKLASAKPERGLSSVGKTIRSRLERTRARVEREPRRRRA